MRREFHREMQDSYPCLFKSIRVPRHEGTEKRMMWLWNRCPQRLAVSQSLHEKFRGSLGVKRLVADDERSNAHNGFLSLCCISRLHRVHKVQMTLTSTAVDTEDTLGNELMGGCFPLWGNGEYFSRLTAPQAVFVQLVPGPFHVDILSGRELLADPIRRRGTCLGICSKSIVVCPF
jgi:hypothetical protein